MCVCIPSNVFSIHTESNEIVCFISFQIGAFYHFKNCRAGHVNASYAYRHTNVKKMELKNTNDFDVRKLGNGELAASERASINAKKEEVRVPAMKFECPKIGCGHQMLRIDTGGFQCVNCDVSYSTFKFRGDESKIDDKAKKKSPAKRGAAAAVVDIDGDDDTKVITPKKRALRARK